MPINPLNGNRYFYQVEQILRDILSTNFVKVIHAIGPDAAFPYHNKILAAFEAKDCHRAKEFLKKYIDWTIDFVKQKSSLS